MSKLENAVPDLDQPVRPLQDGELDAVTGGIILHGAEVSGFIINWSASSANDDALAGASDQRKLLAKGGGPIRQS